MLIGTYSASSTDDDDDDDDRRRPSLQSAEAAALAAVRVLLSSLSPELSKRLVHWGDRPMLLLPIQDDHGQPPPPPQQAAISGPRQLLREIAAVTVRGLGQIRKKYPALALALAWEALR